MNIEIIIIIAVIGGFFYAGNILGKKFVVIASILAVITISGALYVNSNQDAIENQMKSTVSELIGLDQIIDGFNTFSR